jgi:hypothetical protein
MIGGDDILLFYNKRKRQNRPYPSHLFNHLVHLHDEEGEELHIFPENIQVVNSVCIANSYGEPLKDACT